MNSFNIMNSKRKSISLLFLGYLWLSLVFPIKASDLPHRREEARLEIKNLNDTLLNIVSNALPRNVIISPDDISMMTITGHDQIYPIHYTRALTICSLNLSGKDTRHNKIGNHAVSPLGGIHFKVSDSQYSLDHGSESAAYYFHKLLVGDGVTPSTFCVVENVKILKKNQLFFEQFMIQASLTVKGEPLNELLRRCTIPSSVEFDLLSNKSVSAWILTSFLTCPNDAKDDNFMIEKKGPSYNLISIDSDMISFYPYFYKENLDSEPELEIDFRNVLFLLPKFMGVEPDIMVQNIIRNINENDFFYFWLSNLNQLNKNYKRLLKRGIIDEDTYINENFPIEFSLATLQNIAIQLKKLQFWLGRGGTCSDLLRNIHPLVYDYYKKLRKEARYSKQPWESLTILYKNKPSINSLMDNKMNQKMKDGRILKEVITQEIAKAKYLQEDPLFPVDVILDTLYPNGLINKHKIENTEDIPPLHSCQLTPSEKAFIEAYESDDWDNVVQCSLPESCLSEANGHMLQKILDTRKNCLKGINLYFNYLTIESLKWLTPILRNQVNLTDLNLCDNDLREKGIAKLTEIFPFLPLLEILNVSGNNIQNTGMKALWAAPSFTLQKLKYLGLAENKLSDESNNCISAFITQHQNLEEIDLRWNKFTEQMGSTLLPLATQHQNLCVLYLTGNAIPSPVKEAIYIELVRKIISFIRKENNSLKKNKYFELLEKFNFKCSKNLLISIRKILLKKSFTLDFQLYEELNPLIISLIKESIGTTPCLEKIYIFYAPYKYGYKKNQITTHNDLFINSLLENISYCPNLTRVYFSGFRISDYLRLIKGMKNHSPLKSLGLRFIKNENANTPMAFQLIQEILAFKKLRELDLSSNGIQNELALIISNLISKFPHLRFLDLRKNRIKDTGVQALIQAKANHPSLKTLLLNGQT